MWNKIGLIFDKPAQLPTIIKIKDRIRIYYSFRINGKSHINFLETNAENPQEIVYENQIPVLGTGKRGCFDDMGVMPSCVVLDNNCQKMFYTGWNCDKGNVPYGHAIGIAIFDENKNEFYRISDGPILDRSFKSPYLLNSPYVLENEMWFCNGNGWQENFACYNIVHAVFINNTWEIDSEEFGEKGLACSRPCIIKEKSIVHMWYSSKNKNTTYEINYAKKENGTWTESKNIITKSENGWDSQMMCYPFVFNVGSKMYMYYNGNDYGKSGIGLAEWKT